MLGAACVCIMVVMAALSHPPIQRRVKDFLDGSVYWEIPSTASTDDMHVTSDGAAGISYVTGSAGSAGTTAMQLAMSPVVDTQGTSGNSGSAGTTTAPLTVEA